MFPFFILTKTIVETSTHKLNFMDKFFAKTYKTSPYALNIFLLSCLAGYPMGAKIICSYFEQGKITRQQAQKMLSFCSISGPMFMIGTVGVGIFKSFKMGVVILASNVIAALINGLIYKSKCDNNLKESCEYSGRKKEVFLSDIMYDSLISILMVGGFIVLSFLIIDSLSQSNILPILSNTISSVCLNKVNPQIVQSILSGFIEITRGVIDIKATNINIKIATVLTSGLIGFGGLSIMMQSVAFLKKLNMKFKDMFLQKITQGIIATLISILLVFAFF